MQGLLKRAVESPRAAVWLAYDAAQAPSIVTVGGGRPADPQASRLPAIYPEWLGDRALLAEHPARFCYVVGEMARGIATPRMVIEAVRAGCLGFYGSAGLPLAEIKAGVKEIQAALGPDQVAWGANLIHSPQEPGQEAAIVDLFLAQGVRRVSASAFMRLTADVVRYTALGLERGSDGTIRRRNHLFAKVSRAEVAVPFISPAPEKMLRELVAAGKISELQADLAAKVKAMLDEIRPLVEGAAGREALAACMEERIDRGAQSELAGCDCAYSAVLKTRPGLDPGPRAMRCARIGRRSRVKPGTGIPLAYGRHA